MNHRHTQSKVLAWLLLLPVSLLVGCGGGEMPAESPMEEPEPVSDSIPQASTGGSPRVFFVTPEDGRQYSSDFDVAMEFGSENYEISAIPEGFDAETDEPRADVGHYHVGVDTGCLPAGEVIPQGQGWVHFGDGSNIFSLQVESGFYELSLQIGNDEHRTQDGLCETINIEVADGI